MANNTYLQTIPSEEALFSVEEINGFLNSIADGGGRSNYTRTSTFPPEAGNITLQDFSGTHSSNWEDIALFAVATPETILPGVLLIYADDQNWALYNTFEASPGINWIVQYDRVFASEGTAPAVGSNISVYRSVAGVDLNEWLDFFTTTPSVTTNLTTFGDFTVSNSPGGTPLTYTPSGGTLTTDSLVDADFVTVAGNTMRLRILNVPTTLGVITQLTTLNVGALDINTVTGVTSAAINPSINAININFNSAANATAGETAIRAAIAAGDRGTSEDGTYQLLVHETAGGSGSFRFDNDSRTWSAGDSFRIRVFADGADHATATPLVDIIKSISGDDNSTAMSAFNSPDGTRVEYMSDVVGSLSDANYVLLSTTGQPDVIRTGIGGSFNNWALYGSDRFEIDFVTKPRSTGITSEIPLSIFIQPTEQIPLRIDIQSVVNGEIGELLGDLSRDFQFAITDEVSNQFSHLLDDGDQLIAGVSNSIDVTLNTADQTIASGSMIITGWDVANKIATAQFRSGVVSLADAIEGKLMSSADWSDQEHAYSMDTWRTQNALQTHPDYYYPMIDFGHDEDGRPRIPAEEALSRANVSVQTDYAGGSIDVYGNSHTQWDLSNLQNIQNAGTAQTTGYGGNNIIVQPTRYFGEVATGLGAQGYITSPSTPLRIDQLTPAIKLKVVLDKIANIAGATFEYPGDNDTDWVDTMLDDCYILPKSYEGLGIIHDGDNPDDGFNLEQSSVAIANINPDGRSANRGIVGNVYTFGATGAITRRFPATQPAYLANGSYTTQSNGSYNFTFSGNISQIADPGRNTASARRWVRMRATIKVNGEIVMMNEFDEVDTNNFGDFNTTDDSLGLFELTYKANLMEGDVVTAEIEKFRSRGAQTTSATITNVVWRTTETALEWEGLTINPGLQFGEQTADEVLQAIVQKFNLVIEGDRQVRNHYRIYQYNDWILAGDRVDWSERVDQGSMSFTPVLPEQEQTLVFSGAEDDDRLSKDAIERLDKRVYGSVVITDESDVTSGERTVGEGFAPLIVASPSTAGDVGKNITPDPQNGIPHLYEWDSTEPKAMATKLRIGFSKRINMGVFYYANATNDVAIQHFGQVRTLSNTSDNAFGQLSAIFGGTPNKRFDINFGSVDETYSDGTVMGAYDLLWSQSIDRLYSPTARKLTCQMRFTPEEYSNLIIDTVQQVDPRLRYRGVQVNDTIHLFGRDYLINKINGFNLSDPDLTEVELITFDNNLTTVFTAMRNRFVNDPGDLFTNLLGVRVVGQDGGVDIDDSLRVSLELSTDAGVTYTALDSQMYSLVGAAAQGSDPAETALLRARISSNTNYGVQASDRISDNVSTLTGVTLGTPVDAPDGGDVLVPITLTAQSSHIFNELILTWEVNALPTGTIAVTLNTAEASPTSVSNGTVATPRLVQSGRPGDTIQFRVELSEDDGHNLVTTGYGDNAGMIPGLTQASVRSFFGGLVILYTYDIPTTETMDFAITPTLNPTASSVVAPTAQRRTLTVNFREVDAGTPTNLMNVSLGRAQIVLSGEPGDQDYYDLVIGPDYRYRTPESVWSSAPVVVGTTTVANAGTSIQNGPGVILRIDFTIPTTNQTITVDVEGEDALSDDPTVATAFRTITYSPATGAANFTTSEGDLGSPITETFEGNENSIAASGHQFTIAPLEGFEYTDADDVTIVSATNIVGGTGGITRTLVGGSIVLTYSVAVDYRNYARRDTI